MNEFPRTMKMVTVWLLVGCFVYFVFAYFQKTRVRSHFSAAGDIVEIHRGADGHYHWPGSINGHSVEFLIDTGATGTAMSAGLARELGLEGQGSVMSQTAGGLATGEVMRADITLRGGVRVENLRVVALPSLGDRPLLGMDVLGKLRWKQHKGVLTFDLREDADPSSSSSR